MELKWIHKVDSSTEKNKGQYVYKLVPLWIPSVTHCWTNLAVKNLALINSASCSWINLLYKMNLFSFNLHFDSQLRSYWYLLHCQIYLIMIWNTNLIHVSSPSAHQQKIKAILISLMIANLSLAYYLYLFYSDVGATWQVNLSWMQIIQFELNCAWSIAESWHICT